VGETFEYWKKKQDRTLKTALVCWRRRKEWLHNLPSKTGVEPVDVAGGGGGKEDERHQLL
jgi:hypothetical protein